VMSSTEVASGSFLLHMRANAPQLAASRADNTHMQGTRDVEVKTHSGSSCRAQRPPRCLSTQVHTLLLTMVGGVEAHEVSSSSHTYAPSTNASNVKTPRVARPIHCCSQRMPCTCGAAHVHTAPAHTHTHPGAPGYSPPPAAHKYVMNAPVAGA
jgi:hypothetical protein